MSQVGALLIGKGKGIFVALATVDVHKNLASISEIIFQGDCPLRIGDGVVLPATNWGFFPLAENFRPYAVDATNFYEGEQLPAKYMGLSQDKQDGYGVVIEERPYDNRFVQYVVAFAHDHVAPFAESELVRLNQ